jgi:hypothetical protein
VLQSILFWLFWRWSQELFAQRAGGVAQVVRYLPSKCEATTSDPSTIKKKEIK